FSFEMIPPARGPIADFRNIGRLLIFAGSWRFCQIQSRVLAMVEDSIRPWISDRVQPPSGRGLTYTFSRTLPIPLPARIVGSAYQRSAKSVAPEAKLYAATSR